MTISISNVQRLRMKREASGSFAVDGTGTLGDYTDVPFVEGTLQMTIEQPTQSPMHAQWHIDGYPEEVLMPRRGTLTFALNLETLTTRAALGVQAGRGALGELLYGIMGAETRQTGTDINDATVTTTAFTVTTGTNLTIGVRARSCDGNRRCSRGARDRKHRDQRCHAQARDEQRGSRQRYRVRLGHLHDGHRQRR